MDNALLLQRVVQQDSQALEMLYDRYSRLVYSLVYRVVREPATAEELVQEVFLQVWRNAASFQPERGTLEAWLVTITRNRALDSLRAKASKQRKLEQESDDSMTDAAQFSDLAAAPALSPEERIDQQTRARVVRSQISSLPAKHRLAIEMAYFQGLSQSEIAESLGEPLGTVKTWMRGALARLREGLAEVGYGL